MFSIWTWIIITAVVAVGAVLGWRSLKSYRAKRIAEAKRRLRMQRSNQSWARRQQQYVEQQKRGHA